MGCVAMLSILSVSSNEINSRIQERSSYHMTLKSHFTSKRQAFTVRKRGVFVGDIAYTLPGLFACLIDWWITVFKALLCSHRIGGNPELSRESTNADR